MTDAGARDPKTQWVIERLKVLYKEKMLPVESLYKFNEFHMPFMIDAEFEAVPQVLMIGQYSTGKTSFIEYLLGRKFPGQRVGPEPTTDRFVAVMHHTEERVVPGHALAVQQGSAFRGLERFGTGFLEKFEGAQVPSKILQNMTLVDTPGILSGEKQRLQRGYDFTDVCNWFAKRSDLILLLFDAHKLDISDEFKRTIERLRGMDDKIRCVLNKADAVDEQKLMRIYGALMWSMGKIVDTPEVLRVFVGSFWDHPLDHDDCAKLFEAEEADLMADFRALPRNSAVRKINELVKRARLAKVHACIIGHLQAEMPSLMGKEKKQKELMANLPNVFRAVQKAHGLPPGDFPDIEEFQAKLGEGYLFNKFPKLKTALITSMDEVLARDIPELMAHLPKREEVAKSAEAGGFGSGGGAAAAPQSAAADTGNPFAKPPLAAPSSGNPFGDAGGGVTGPTWVAAADKARYDELFESLGPTAGKLSGGQVMGSMQATGAATDALRMIWELSDVDKDQNLDADEFALAMWLCNHVADGNPCPDELEPDMVPPSKR
jgi:EH domain-containing protein 1